MEPFIEAVRKHPCLWNINDRDYRHGEKKEIAWNNIARLNIPETTDAVTAKAEWKKLRDNHRDSLKRQKSGKTGQAADFVNNWKYAQVMEFLIPYMKHRDKPTNLAKKSTQDINTPDPNKQETNSQQFAQEPSIEQPLQSSTQNVNMDNNSLITGDSGTAGLPQDTRKRKNNDDIVDIIREMEANHTRCRKERDMRRIQEKNHPIELFFQSMAETSKPMPTFMQNRIKKKVLQIVCDAEEELESYNMTPTYGYSTSPTPSPSV